VTGDAERGKDQGKRKGEPPSLTFNQRGKTVNRTGVDCDGKQKGGERDSGIFFLTSFQRGKARR